MDKRLKYALIGSGVALTLLYIFRKPIKVGALKVIQFALKPAQEAAIKRLNPDVQNVFREFISRVEEKGYIVTITSDYRSFSEQAKEHAANKKNAPAGASWHNYGGAIDMNATSLRGKSYKKATPKAEWEKTGIPAIAKKLGLYWGANIPNYYDPVHFDVRKIVNKRPSQLLAEAQKRYGSNPNNIKGNKVPLLA